MKLEMERRRQEMGDREVVWGRVAKQAGDGHEAELV